MKSKGMSSNFLLDLDGVETLKMSEDETQADLTGF